MNSPHRTTVSRKELWQKQKQNNLLLVCRPQDMETGHRTDNYQILFSLGCKQPLRDNYHFLIKLPF